MTIDEFIEKCQKRPIPNDPMGRVRLLARELAEGAMYEVWLSTISTAINKAGGKSKIYITDNIYKQYFQIRWENNYPNLELLIKNGYISSDYKITKKSFSLLDEVEDSTVFISYKRDESSAFALLVNNTLRQHGIEPFIDMQLQAGDDWHAELEQNIKNSDYFILLMSHKTLKSKVTLQEIVWALEANVTMIPIWHNSFEFEADQWHALPKGVKEALASTHTIRVLEENPLTYDTALRELLNRFGING